MSDYYYDKTNPKSIEEYAKKLEGMTFRDVMDLDVEYQESRAGKGYGNAARKGGLGNLIEERYFHYAANSDSSADFKEAGVELKVTPYEKKSRGKLSAGERLVLTMISYEDAVEPDFYRSHLWDKCRCILLIYYLRDKSLGDNLDYQIDYVTLFTPPEKDLEIIKRDYQIIIDKIAAGKAHELSESDTMYLGACTKGSTAEKSTVPQKYYNPAEKARKRAFCFKNSYMTYVLNNYIVTGDATYELPLKQIASAELQLEQIASVEELRHNSFEDIVESRINSYIGKTDKELCILFEREYNNNKAQWNDLAYRMLGIKSNKAEEFVKAQIVVKIIRIEENGKIRESMSLPTFKYMELIQEEWEDSTLRNYFDENRFLFVVFKSNGYEYVLKGCQFWNMPYEDLEGDMKNGWQSVVDVIENGVQLEIARNTRGIVVNNNLPKKSDNRITHVRPHASKRYFKFKDGTIIGDGSPSDANELPDGTWMPNYCFWLNNDYVLSQLDEELKK